MTIGQRIAECRKALGISQEGLGEQMGVSRQAISKWEADGAIPEIDKLIALSRLFGVSVGWLLGTEDSPKPEAGLNDEQLEMIERIMQRYQHSEPKRKPVAMLICLGCALLALILSVIGLSKVNSRLGNREYQLGELPEAYSSVRSQLQQMADRLDVFAAGERILSYFEAEIGTIDGWEKGRVVFRAVPKSRQSGDEAYLSLWQNGEEKYFMECVWTGTEFQVEAEVAYGEYDGYFVQCRGGVFQMQNVSKELENLSDAVQTDCFLGVGATWWDAENSRLCFGHLILQVKPPRAAIQEGNEKWTSLDLVVKRNGEEVLRMDVWETFETNARWQVQNDGGIFSDSRLESILSPHEINVDRERLEALVLEIPGLKDWDRITFVVEGQLSNGYSFENDVYAMGL